MRKTIIWTAVVCVCACALAAQVAAPSTTEIGELKQKAAAGDAKAQIALARAYEKGEGAPQNDELAVKWYRAAAEQGDAQAQNDLGVMYRLGHGVEKDYEQARQWYLKAARQNFGPALFNLGTLYYNGNGVEVDDNRAYAYFVLAREAGSKDAEDAVRRAHEELSPLRLKEARFFLAEFLEGGEGPAQPQRAAKGYEELAREGNAVAQVRLAKMYMDGRGVGKDAAKARDYCERAAKRDFTPGMVCIGFLYESGQLGANAFGDAVSWYEKAAKKGNPIAMYSLGFMYTKGAGVKQDDAKAYLWMLRAALARVAQAGPALQALEPKLNKKQIDDAKKKVRETPILILTGNPELREFAYAPKFDRSTQ